jgi:Zn-dependent protease with chaperone function
MSAGIRELSRRENFCLFGLGGFLLWVPFCLVFYLFLAVRYSLHAFIEKCLAQCSSFMTLAFSAVEGVRLSLVLGLLVLFLIALAISMSEVWRVCKFSRSLKRVAVSPRLGRLLRESGLPPDRVLLFPSALSFACTAGLFLPRIFISTHLVDSLSDEEVKAVLRHEQSHLRRRDPLRGVLIGFFAHFFFFIPTATKLLQSLRRDSELIADDHALSFSHSPAVLASALVKVMRDSLVQAKAMTGFTDGDLLGVRLNRILGIKLEKDVLGSRRTLSRTVAGLVLVFSFVFLVLPTGRAFPKAAPWHCHHADHETCCPSGGAGGAHAHGRS